MKQQPKMPKNFDFIYKQAGNGVTVTVIQRIGERLEVKQNE